MNCYYYNKILALFLIFICVSLGSSGIKNLKKGSNDSKWYEEGPKLKIAGLLAVIAYGLFTTNETFFDLLIKPFFR